LGTNAASRLSGSGSALGITPGEVPGDVGRLLVGHVAADRAVERDLISTTSTEIITRLLPEQREAHILVLALALGQQRLDLLEDGRVEGARESAIRGDDHDLKVLALVVSLEQRMRLLERPLGDLLEGRTHAHGVGTRVLDRLLRAPKLCRRHHLHGGGDLLRGLDARDASFDVAEIRHR
jgi:hypothetical protein